MPANSTSVKLIECPRDAMQGLHEFIPTADKVRYINALLKIGFDTIDFGSFVSPKAIPQMSDTAEVLSKLLLDTTSKLLAIIANVRGAQEVVSHEVITYLGFPLSLSETFQQRNTNRSIEEALKNLEEIQGLCHKHNKILVTYLSMGFGNPYGDPYTEEYIEEFVNKLDGISVKIISLSDTVGIADEPLIKKAFSSVVPNFPHIEFGAHLHSVPDKITSKVEAAYQAGCRRFDGALKGFGGCPMAKDDLVGNMATERMIAYFDGKGVNLGIDKNKLADAMIIASEIFPVV